VISFNVNGQNVESNDINKKLITFLREDLRLTSVKEGCSEGACGTCMVIADGKAKRACLLPISTLAGKSITTVEGLSPYEKEIYSHCFKAAGAVQCGFCIPGMVISAKAFLDTNPDPTRVEIKKAIRANICRCTGYTKIEDAILMAAGYFNENIKITTDNSTGILGENLYRIDADEKTLGTGIYTDDLIVENMVYAKALRTKYPRARIINIDTAEAEKHPECIKIITAEDVPGNIKCGHLIKDWDALIATGNITRYIGDAIAIIVAVTNESLNKIITLIKVDYEQLETLSSPEMSLTKNAPQIHEEGNILSKQELKRGNVNEAIKKAAHTITKHFSLPFTEHAFMEPECAVAIPNGKDGLLIYSGEQSIYDEQREISSLLNISKEKIQVKSMLVGGGFGGKEDMSVQHHAALAAWLVKKPVKIKFSRQESISVHPKRHAMEIDITVACDENGILTAVKANIISDTGAYASLGGPVLQRACTHAGGPYNFQNIEVTGTAVYTSNPPAGAFRGFGVPQSSYAMESCLNLLAEKLGISQWEIRYRNAIRPGQILPNGQIADAGTALEECLNSVKNAFDASENTGIACGFKNSGLGVGVPDTGRCILSIEKGKIHIRSSAACIGQGMATVLTQMVCTTLKITPELIIVEPPDTSRTPDSGTTTASRQTLFSGEAAVVAARKLQNEISVITKQTLLKYEGKEYYGEYKPETNPINSDKVNPVSHVAYGYAAQVAQLDDQGELVKVTAAYDVGTVVNPIATEGQIEGGIVMGMGYALTEDFPVENGYPKVKYGTLGLIRAPEAPEIETIIIKKDTTLNAPAYGAKGVGELATIPTAPAIHGAYYKKDGKFRTKLPMEGTFYRNDRKNNK